MKVAGVIRLDKDDNGQMDLTYPLYVYRDREHAERILNRPLRQNELVEIEFVLPELEMG